ncbi:MAG TPA: tRNA-dihydrouridine synthase family protein [Treponemataceae bacterium]|nr:tRNA-dihydrouridine synthase family protein [Treponemataceae bacterium]
MKLALAPMATLSHEALRILINRWGDPDEYYSEMIHAPSFVAGGHFEPWYVRTAPSPERMVWQLTGGEGESIVKAARLLLPLGGIGLDLNMGCSAPDIARFGAGIAWMSKPYAEVSRLVTGVRGVIDEACTPTGGAAARLGVKLRLGETEDYEKLLAFCRMLVDSGVDLVTLHPRVRRDKSRPARRAYVARLAGDLSVPVYGNGDIASVSDALDYARDIPCSGIMLGRAAVQKPWIFRDIRDAFATESIGGVSDSSASAPCDSPETIDHLEVAEFFLSTLARSQPGEFQLSRAHRFFFYYCDNFSFAHHIKMKIQNAKSTADIPALLGEYFAQVPQDRYLALPALPVSR